MMKFDLTRFSAASLPTTIFIIELLVLYLHKVTLSSGSKILIPAGKIWNTIWDKQIGFYFKIFSILVQQLQLLVSPSYELNADDLFVWNSFFTFID